MALSRGEATGEARSLTLAPPGGDSAPDDKLVAEAMGGSVRALETLLVSHQGKVLRILRLLGIPLQDREDVAQEIFIRVFRHLNGFKSGQPFSGWLYRVTVNAAHDYRVRAGRRMRQEVPWEKGLEDSPDREAHPDEAMGQADMRARLEDALVELSDRERAVFVLRELEGLETVEVAKVLGITRITVRRHLGLARRRLRDALTEKKHPAR